MSTLRFVLFYCTLAALSVVVWISLARFARLPDGIHKGFFGTMFATYLFGAFALSNWFENRKVKHHNLAVSNRLGWFDYALLAAFIATGFAFALVRSQP